MIKIYNHHVLLKLFYKKPLTMKNFKIEIMYVIFGITVTLMFLDPMYNQAEISSSKLQERGNQN